MTTAPNQPTGTDLIMSTVAIVPGPSWTLTFVLRNRGVFAGHWLLPGGCIGPGESAEQAARRQAAEDAGVRTGALAPTGIYDVHGGTAEGAFWLRLHVYRALRPCAVPEDFVADPADIAGIDQAHPSRILPHPTDMRILNDAGLADYDPDLVTRLLSADGVAMTRLDPS